MYYLFLFFFFVTATIEIYSLSLHDALPIFFTPLLELLGVSQAGGQYGIKIFLIKNRISHHYAGPGILNMKIIAAVSGHKHGQPRNQPFYNCVTGILAFRKM